MGRGWEQLWGGFTPFATKPCDLGGREGIFSPLFFRSFRESATLEARRGARNHFLSVCCTVCSAFTAGAHAVGGKMRRKEGKGGRKERKEGKGKMKTLDRLTHRGGRGRQGEEGSGTLTKDLLLGLLLLLLLLPCSFLPRLKRMPKEFEKLSSCVMLCLPLPVFFQAGWRSNSS